MGSENGEVTERLLKELDVPLADPDDVVKAGRAHHPGGPAAGINKTLTGILEGSGGPVELAEEAEANKVTTRQDLNKQVENKGQVGWTRKF